MKISARNCLKGTIIAIKEGPVTTEVTIETEAKGCIYETDLLERNGVKLSEGGKVEREFHPYEVVTLLVKR